MNCIEFRRLCLSDPNCADAVFLEHPRQCGRCADFLARQRGLDRQIGQAMQIPVPRRIGPQAVLERGIRQMRQWRLVAIAASVVTAVALISTLSLQLVRPDAPPAAVAGLEQQLNLHMLRDPIHAVASPASILGHQHAENSSLAKVVNRLGGEFLTEPEGLRHAVMCLIKGKMAAHLVFEGRHAPVTAFVLPGQSTPDDYILTRHDQQTWISAHGRGLIAVIGHQNEDHELYIERVKHSLRLDRIIDVETRKPVNTSHLPALPPMVSSMLESP